MSKHLFELRSHT